MFALANSISHCTLYTCWLYMIKFSKWSGVGGFLRAQTTISNRVSTPLFTNIMRVVRVVSGIRMCEVNGLSGKVIRLWKMDERFVKWPGREKEGERGGWEMGIVKRAVIVKCILLNLSQLFVYIVVMNQMNFFCVSCQKLIMLVFHYYYLIHYLFI